MAAPSRWPNVANEPAHGIRPYRFSASTPHRALQYGSLSGIQSQAALRPTSNPDEVCPRENAGQSSRLDAFIGPQIFVWNRALVASALTGLFPGMGEDADCAAVGQSRADWWGRHRCRRWRGGVKRQPEAVEAAYITLDTSFRPCRTERIACALVDAERNG